MPKSRWWVAAIALLVYWTFYSGGHRFSLSRWWDTVMNRPLGEWYMNDLTPFLGIYILAHLLIPVFIDLETEQKPVKESEPQAKQ